MKQSQSPVKLWFVGLVSALTVVGCSDTFMKSSPRSKTTGLADLTSTVDAAGNISAAFDPSSGSVQVLRLSSGSLAGAGIAIPPGALSIPVSITVGSGDTLASSSFTQELGISGNNITAGGPSVSFIPSETVQANVPFTLSIPTSSSALRLDSANSSNLIVLYRWTKVENGVPSYVMGLIPKDDVIVSTGKVSFLTKYFGMFQIGYSETPIREKISAATVVPPVLKADVQFPLAGKWRTCKARTIPEDNDGDNGGGSSGGSTGGGGTVDWSGGNSTAFPSGCFSSTSLNMYVNITGSQTYYLGTSYGTTQATLSTMTPVGDFGYSLTSSLPQNTSTLVWQASYSTYSGKLVTLWAPPGCAFVDVGASPPTSFLALPLTSANVTGSSTCSVNPGNNVVLTCTDTPPSGGGGGSGGGNSNYGGGRDYLGADPGTTYYEEESALITRTTFTHELNRFADKDCKGAFVSKMVETGKFTLPDGETSVSQKGFKINLTRSTQVATLYTSAAVSAANDDPDRFGCGLSDWTTSQSKNLVDSKCDDDASDKTYYTRFYIDGKKLFFCDSNDHNKSYGSSDASRVPNCDSYDTSNYMEKQTD